jgi:hypothetical protein
MAAVRRFDWVRRYSLCFVIFLVIFIIQIFLASKLFPSEYPNSAYQNDGVNAQGKSPVYSEVKTLPRIGKSCVIIVTIILCACQYLHKISKLEIFFKNFRGEKI